MDLDVVIAKLEWIEGRHQERHNENSARLSRIEVQVNATNGRVTRAESDILALQRDQERAARVTVDLENAPMSIKSSKAIAGWIAASLGSLYWVMTQMLGFHR